MPQITKTNTFAPNTKAKAAEINADFDQLFNLINGLLDSDNITALAEAKVTFAATGGHDHGGTGSAVKLKFGANVASATTLSLGNDGNVFQITGTTTITGLGTKDAGTIAILRFAGALTLTHHGTSLILADAVNMTTAAGDIIAMVSEGSGNWRELWRRPAARPKARAIMTFTSIPGGPDPAANQTVYLGFQESNTENGVTWRVPFTCTLKNMYVRAGNAPGLNESFLYTLRKNLADTAIAASLDGAAQTTAADTTHTVTAVAGDELAVKLVLTAAAQVVNHRVTLEVEERLT